MPIASPEQYRELIDAAREGLYACPAVNVSSSETLNAAVRGFADAGSDGIVQISTGGAEFASGGAVKDMALGAKALAEYARVLADRYPVLIALHTDHCPPDKLDRFLRPLLAESVERRARGEEPLFGSHMFDGSSLPLEENLAIAAELLEQCAAADVILEVECGVVGGEEDGVSAEGTPREKLYTTTEDLLRVADVLGTGEKGRYLLAATFGNVHGVYAPGHVKLRPTVLRDGQEALVAAYGADASFDYVFHGGSGSAPEEITKAVGYGVVKLNVDTDMQYAYSRAIAGHMFENYDGVLKVDGGTGDKKAFDPRVWGRKGEEAMAARVAQACENLHSAGRSLAYAASGAAAR
jgi:fructose-bisphosphate aldolase, class II